MAGVKRKDETSNFHHYQPGMTQAKRPALFILGEQNLIDLKREHASRYGHGPRPQNIRDRLSSGNPVIREINYGAPGRNLELQRSLHTHVEVVLNKDALQAAARQTKKRSLWGERDYTADTDVFTALVHQGYLPASVTDISFTWPELIKELRTLLAINESPPFYPSATRNGVCSRVWPSACYGCSFRILRAWFVSATLQQGVEVELDPPPKGTTLEPTKPFFLPSQFDHRISTRQLTHGASDRRRKTAPEVATVVYNLANEPWLKYSYACIADCGFAAASHTSCRLGKEALYLETERERFELCILPETYSKRANPDGPRFCFSRCKEILPQDMMLEAGTPLPRKLVEPLYPRLKWETLQRTDKFKLVRMHWMKAMHAIVSTKIPTDTQGPTDP